jgi:triosephosphate isomerase
MKNTKKILIANWKMNPDTVTEAVRLAEENKKAMKNKKRIELVVCPPHIFISEISNVFQNLKNVHLGAQDVFGGESKSMTGEIGTEMLINSKVEYTLVGHSSRRGLCETDEVVAEKVLGIIKSGMKAVVCIGENERNENGQFYNFVKEQLERSLFKLKKIDLKKLIIAYEPVWAIGKKDTEAMKPEDVHEMVIFIRKVLTDKYGAELASLIPILYGGSVSKRNIENLAVKGEVSGFLIGRESLNIENFTEVIEILETI